VAETWITGIAAVRASPLIVRQTSNPLMSGRFTSSRISSARPALASASAPVLTSVTMWPARRSQVAIT
jgi:hypothetical protein